MNLQRNAAAFLRWSHVERVRFVIAWFQLGLFCFLIRSGRFKRCVANLQHSKRRPAPSPPDAQVLDQARAVARDVDRAGRYTPWESTCLAKSLCVQRMLAKRDIGGVLFLGVHKRAGEPELEAHSWVECGGTVVSGAGALEAYAVLSAYSWGGTG